MTADLELTGSPFDSLRLTDDSAVEYWSARDLMPHLGYEKWENFAAAIERAELACNNSGHQAPDHFRGARKVMDGGRWGSTAAADFHLTRYGAYLLAMNGDPRKAEVAAAQTYFAAKTRQAETMVADLSTSTGVLAMAQQYLAQAQALVAAEQRVAELAPRAAVADQILDADGDLSVADAAKSLARAGIKVGAGRLFALLAGRHWIYRQPSDGRWRVYQAAIDGGWMSVIPQSHYHPKTGVLVLDPPQPRVTPKGLQRLLLELGSTVATLPAAGA